jgi:hypothetical protein
VSSALVAAAARKTLASGSARVWECRFTDPAPPSERSFVRFAEGVADLANVRVHVRTSVPPVFTHLSDRLLERFPWLDDDPEAADGGEDDDGFTIHAGTAGFLGSGDRWMPLGLDAGDLSAGRRAVNDPLWILEALTAAGDATPLSEDPVRGEPCRRLRFDVDLRSAPADLEGRELRGQSDRVTGDVWIDTDDRIRRVTWRRPFMHRPRSPLKLPPFRAWRTVELWDFGIPVDIEIPTPMEPGPGPSPREIYAGVGALWRRKRAYERGR